MGRWIGLGPGLRSRWVPWSRCVGFWLVDNWGFGYKEMRGVVARERAGTFHYGGSRRQIRIGSWPF
jgi:hypothetical protein